MTSDVAAHLDDFAPPERESLKTTEESLLAMQHRMTEILAEAQLTDDTLVELVSIMNNVSYVFLYLEANDDQVSYKHLLPIRAAFYHDAKLNAKILDRLYGVRCQDPKVERARLSYIKQLEELPGVQGEGDEMAALRARARQFESKLSEDQSAFLAKLGLHNISKPPAVFYRLSSRSENCALRSKLGRGWHKVSQRDVMDRARNADQMVALRHKWAKARGEESPLEKTLTKCNVSYAQIAAFLSRYLDSALAEQKKLEGSLIAVYGDTETPFSHFSHYMRTYFSGQQVPSFDLEQCLEFAFEVAGYVFGLRFVRRCNRNAHVIVTDVYRGAEHIGRINFDLWVQNGRDRGANHTLGIRNRTAWRHIVQRPEAFVSCRFDHGNTGQKAINFQNAHSLFHEFGHAINHLLMREHMPNQSGLEYLPLERLEFLSMWFEKWVYHPQFNKVLSKDASSRDDLQLCQQAKKIEYVSTFTERAIIALIDLECHRSPSVTVRDVYDRFDSTMGISRYVSLNELPQYFNWPMFVANPGANFTYLFGATWSAEAFLPFESRVLGAQPIPVPQDTFDCCFDIDMASPALDVANLEAFYFTDLPATTKPTRSVIPSL